MSYFEEEEENDDISSTSSINSDNSDDQDEEENIDENYEEDEITDDDISSIDEENFSNKIKKKKENILLDDNDEDYDDYIYDDSKFKKLENIEKTNYIQEHHPELLVSNNDEIMNLCKIIRNDDNIIIDIFHKTSPFLTKYEKAKILGQRAKQINNGSIPFIKIQDNIMDGSVIALMELKQKAIPLIIKRPLPNGGCEYWRVSDLELLD